MTECAGAAIDQDPAQAGRAQLAKGDFSGAIHGDIKAQRWFGRQPEI
jgi:hypothetical protein